LFTNSFSALFSIRCINRRHRDYNMPIDNDCLERTRATITGLVEAWKMTTGTLLLIFVPQTCDGATCGLSTLALMRDGKTTLRMVAYSFNWVTFACLLCLYATESRRENFCIQYFDVDATRADNHLLTILPTNLKHQLDRHNAHYKCMFLLTAAFFLLNLILSMCYLIPKEWSATTLVSILTFVLLAYGKLNRARQLSNDSKAVRSAYLIENTAFNVLDSDYVDGMVQNNSKDDDHNNDSTDVETPTVEMSAL